MGYLQKPVRVCSRIGLLMILLEILPNCLVSGSSIHITGFLGCRGQIRPLLYVCWQLEDFVTTREPGAIKLRCLKARTAHGVHDQKTKPTIAKTLEALVHPCHANLPGGYGKLL